MIQENKLTSDKYKRVILDKAWDALMLFFLFFSIGYIEKWIGRPTIYTWQYCINFSLLFMAVNTAIGILNISWYGFPWNRRS